MLLLRSEIWLGIITRFMTPPKDLTPSPTCCMHVAEVCWVGLCTSASPGPATAGSQGASGQVGTVVRSVASSTTFTEALVSATGGSTEVVLVSESAGLGYGSGGPASCGLRLPRH